MSRGYASKYLGTVCLTIFLIGGMSSSSSGPAYSGCGEFQPVAECLEAFKGAEEFARLYCDANPSQCHSPMRSLFRKCDDECVQKILDIMETLKDIGTSPTAKKFLKLIGRTIVLEVLAPGVAHAPTSPSNKQIINRTIRHTLRDSNHTTETNRSDIKPSLSYSSERNTELRHDPGFSSATGNSYDTRSDGGSGSSEIDEPIDLGGMNVKDGSLFDQNNEPIFLD